MRTEFELTPSGEVLCVALWRDDGSVQRHYTLVKSFEFTGARRWDCVAFQMLMTTGGIK